MACRVLMFGWEFPPHNSGGLGVASRGLSSALARAGADVLFVLPREMPSEAGGVRFRFADLKNIRVAVVNARLYPYVTEREYALARSLAPRAPYGPTLLDEVRRYAHAARDIAESEVFDVIHAHDWLSFLAGIEAKRVSGKPLVAHVHATEFDRTGGSGVNQDVYDIERLGVHEADAVVAVSHWTKRILVERYGVPPEKIRVVWNGVEPGEFGGVPKKLLALKKRGVKIVLFVGRLTLQKGPDYFISLAKRVIDFYPDAVFVVAGSGDMEERMMRDAARLGISERVLFAGFLRGEELASVYRSADLYVMPSVSEPFGITPLESLMHGTPVLLSKQSGVSEVISHALKADFWDIDAMADQVVNVLRNPALAATLSHYGQGEAGKATWAKAAEACLSLYGELAPNACFVHT